MSHRFKVLHFGGQCPWLWYTLAQVQKAATQLRGNVEVIDVGKTPTLAAQYRLYFPFMVVIDEVVRWPSPAPAELLIQIAKGEYHHPAVPDPPVFYPARASQIVPITPGKIDIACSFCMPAADAHVKQSKREWASQFGETMLGYLAYAGEFPVGGIEYLRASQIPFPVPNKQATTAFITCLYSTEEADDYRGHLLEYTLKQLALEGYQRVQVISGRRQAYPNGPGAMFQAQGFMEVAELDRIFLKDGKDILVLMERNL